jgi:hypothetical protein
VGESGPKSEVFSSPCSLRVSSGLIEPSLGYGIRRLSLHSEENLDLKKDIIPMLGDLPVS